MMEQRAQLSAPMSGLKVLDFSMGVAGPHAGALCAQYGAEVVKVEPPEGDWARVLGQQHGDFTALSVTYNRGKRSLAINLKHEEARRTLREMAVKADVIIEAFRPEVMRKLGLDFDSLSQENPNLIYLSVNGYGSIGPKVREPAVDAVIQAFTGFMHANANPDGVPQRLDFVVIDVVTGLYGFQAIATALLDRARWGGPGRRIECSLTSAALSLQAGKILEDHIEPSGRALYVPLGVFRTADGFISLSTRRDDHFAELCRTLGRPEWCEGGRYTSAESRVQLRDELIPLLEDEFSKYSTEDLSKRLSECGIMNSKVNTYQAVLREPQIEVMNAIAWQQHKGFDDLLPIARVPGVRETDFDRDTPRIGENSLEVLRDWGVAEGAITKMLELGSISATAGRHSRTSTR